MEQTTIMEEVTVKVAKTGCAIIRTKRYIRPTNISAEDYPQIWMAKAN